jgi:hypothetical protein
MFEMNAFFFDKISNSSVLRAWRVSAVNGTPTRRTSMSCRRKLCSDSLSVPEYQALGMLPSGPWSACQ